MKPAQNLSVTYTNYGYFYRAKLNDMEITESELFKIIGIKCMKGRTIEYHLENFENNNPEWNIEFWDKDVC